MPWFYFKRVGNNLTPLNPLTKYLPPRPPDANPDEGDPLTPWYEVDDHFDGEHVHIRGENLEDAQERARKLIASLRK